MTSILLCSLVFALCQNLVLAVTLSRRDTPLYRNSSYSPQERAQDLLSRMTWEEKIGQMGGIRRLLGTNVTFNSTSFDQIYNDWQNGNIGLGTSTNQPADVLPVVNAIRAKQINSTRLGIPFATVMDSVNGIFLINNTLFPSTLSMASSWNLDVYGDAIAAIREENLAMGIQWVLSPELDLGKDPRNGRVGEMYGEDPYFVGTFGTKYVRTMQALDDQGFVKVATTIKHFVYGQSNGGVNMASMHGGVNHVFNSLAAPHMKVIREASPLALMVSYTSLDRVPMAANKFMVQTVLREHIGFKGVIMSDAMAIPWLNAHSRVASSLSDAAMLALRAGLQMELSPQQPAAFPTLVDAANDTEVVQLVDAAVLNLLQVKFATGLFDRPLPSLETLKTTIRSPQHLDADRNISREAIVLLQNDGLLPFNPNSAGKIAVLGPFADLINAGGYAASIPNDAALGNSLRRSLVATLGSQKVEYVQGVDIVDTTNSSGIDTAVAVARNSSLVVLMVGSLSGGSGDLTNSNTDGEGYSHPFLGFPGLQQQLVDSVLDTGAPTVIILSGGQAFALANSTLRANAIMHSFQGGEFTGDALVEILFGQVNPSGKLPFTLPQISGAWPIAYNYLNSDNYGGPGGLSGVVTYDWQLPLLTRNPPMAFGFGLSYTTFNVSSPTATVQSGSEGNTEVVISATVSNTGSVTGKEVVQLYFRQLYTNILETGNRQLVRFEKLTLSPGQSQNITFTVAHDELGYYKDMELQLDGGAFTFWLGTSSRLQDLQSVNVTIAG